MKRFELLSFPDPDALAQTVAALWLADMRAASSKSKPYCVALSGGRIALKLFACLAAQSRAAAFSFEQVHFFWADERCVPPGDAESNFRAAQDILFAPLGIPDSQIHRIPGERDPESAAAEAEAEIHQVVKLKAGSQPVLDLVLLGMGEDGHVASLFPGVPAELRSENAVYHAVQNSPKPPPNRVTLGYAAIRAAQAVWVLVSGSGKQEALRRSLACSGETPLARVLMDRSHTKIFTDNLLE